jgi:hypothetical protein
VNSENKNTNTCIHLAHILQSHMQSVSYGNSATLPAGEVFYHSIDILDFLNFRQKRHSEWPHNTHWYIFKWRAPQQSLRTHRSLKAYCAALWWWSFLFFHFNGAPVEWNW